MYGDVRAAADALPEHRVRCPITVAAGAGAEGAFERAAPLIAQRLPRARFERCGEPHVCLGRVHRTAPFLQCRFGTARSSAGWRSCLFCMITAPAAAWEVSLD